MRKCYYYGVEYIIVNRKNAHDYFAMQNTLVERFISSFITNRLSYNCISDIPDDTDDFDLSYIKTGVKWSVIKNKENPLLGLIDSIKFLQDSIIDTLISSENRHINILINKNGGYQPINDVDDVDDIKDFVFCGYESLIREGTKYLVIENGDKLESDAIGFLRTVDKKYSYILNLRSVDNNKLTELMRTFYGYGGKYIYVYTTGSDIEQIENYIKCSLDAYDGFNKFGVVAKPIFIFEFSGNVDKKLSDFMFNLERKGDITITIIGGVI